MSSGATGSNTLVNENSVNAKLNMDNLDVQRNMTESEKADISGSIDNNVSNNLENLDTKRHRPSSSQNNIDVSASSSIKPAENFDEVDRGMPAGWLAAEEPRRSKPKVNKQRLQKLLDDDGIPDGKWEETIDEPEMEFDELTMDLETAQIRDDMSDKENAHIPSVSDDDIRAEGFTEEDFEQELGSPPEADDNDPELAYRDISQHGIIQVAGDDAFGRKVIVFSACHLPPREELDHQKLLGFLKHTLDQYVENDYTLVYFHYGLVSSNKPSFGWLRQAYAEFDRKYKKNLKALYIVHPTTFISFMWTMVRPFISSKFSQKIFHLKYLHELAQHVQLDQLIIPPDVRHHDAELLAKNKPQPVPSSIIHAPLPTQQFGVELDFIKRHNGGEIIPPVIRQCIAYLRENALDTEGIFRRCANVAVLRKVQNAFNEGATVNFDELGDVQIPAAILKSFLRQLPEPILTYELYDHIIRVQSLESDERLFEMRRILTEELPADNYYVLKYVIQFLTEVVDKSDQNMMTPMNLSIVFGPNLLWSKNEATLSLMGYVHSCAYFMIVNYNNLFVK